MNKVNLLGQKRIHQYTDSIFGEDLHAKRVLSLANAVVGCITVASLAIHTIGIGLASACGLRSKHAIKQADRLIGNTGLELSSLLVRWVQFCVGSREEIIVTLDWTEFDADNHSTLALNMVTRHGRATPLMWKTVVKTDLKGRRNDHEDDLLGQFKDALPPTVAVTVLADRGFGDVKLYKYLQELGFNFIIRFREGIQVTDASGTTKTAKEWLQGTKARLIKGASVTAQKYSLSGVVVAHAKGMKDAWCLAVSDPAMKASVAVTTYNKRFTTEENFRDTKDPHFGMGMRQMRIERTDRRDRLLLVSALSIALLTLLGAAGEATGLDAKFKANTVKTRTHSLFRQGCMYFQCMVTMRDEWLSPLLEKFESLLIDHAITRDIFGVL